ncbi:MAG: nucleotidyltransferase family protein [Ilumatobacteraceae bacterium]
MNLLAVLLAAGGGTRFGGATHKLLADLHGRPLWRTSLEHLLAARIAPVVLITGAADLDTADFDRAHRDRAHRDRAHHDQPIHDSPIEVIHNPDWATGQASSLQLGVAAARRAGADAMVIGLADQPFVEPSAWRAVADAPAQCLLVVASYDGRRGPNPVRIASELWDRLPETGDEGARGLLLADQWRVCSVDCLGSANDIDTLEDLERWTRS